MDPKKEDATSQASESQGEDKSESESSKSSQFKTLNLKEFSAPTAQQATPNALSFPAFPNAPMQMNMFNGMMPMSMNFNMMLNQYQPPKNNYIKPFVSLPDYSDAAKIKNAFASCSNFNDPSFDVDGIQNAQFFIIRSTNDDDLHKSIKYGIWASTYKNNQHLHHTFLNCRNNKTPIYLFFTVVSSEQYTGVAQMISDVEFSKTFGYWWEDSKWMGVFQVKWLFIKDVNYESVAHLQDRYAKPVIQMRDGTRLSYENGVKMMKIFKEAETDSSIFDDFEYMDNREEKLRISREMMNMMYKNMKQMMGGSAKEEEEKEEDHHRGRRQFKNNYKGENNYRGHHQQGSNFRGRRHRFNNRRRGGYNNDRGNVYKRKDQSDSHRDNGDTVYVNKSKLASNGARRGQNQEQAKQETKPLGEPEQPAQILVKKKNKQRKAKKRKNKKGRRRDKKDSQDDDLYYKKSDYLEEVKQTQAKKRKAQEEEESEYEVKNAVVGLPPADN